MLPEAPSESASGTQAIPHQSEAHASSGTLPVEPWQKVASAFVAPAQLSREEHAPPVPPPAPLASAEPPVPPALVEPPAASDEPASLQPRERATRQTSKLTMFMGIRSMRQAAERRSEPWRPCHERPGAWLVFGRERW